MIERVRHKIYILTLPLKKYSEYGYVFVCCIHKYFKCHYIYHNTKLTVNPLDFWKIILLSYLVQKKKKKRSGLLLIISFVFQSSNFWHRNILKKNFILKINQRNFELTHLQTFGFSEIPISSALFFFLFQKSITLTKYNHVNLIVFSRIIIL